MMLPLPRIILIDDNRDHLRGLADGLNKCGAACLQVHFQGDGDDVKRCPHVRVIFADLHLTQAGPGSDYAKDFTVIGGLIEEKIIPAGPYVIVLWTQFADQARNLERFLHERLKDVAKPVAVRALDKAKHLDVKGEVTSIEALASAIEGLFDDEPQLRALMNWEERILGAAAETIATLLGIAMTDAAPEKRKGNLGRLLRTIGTEAVGEKNLAADRFRAVNEGLLPILADRISFLRSGSNSAAIWDQALEGEETHLSSREAAELNRMLHLAEGVEAGSASDRGAVITIPATYFDAFTTTFGVDEDCAAEKQFGCKDYARGDSRFCWILVQIQASCDFAQRQPGPLPYLLGLEMPDESKKDKKALPGSVWQSVVFRLENSNRVLHTNARFGISLSEAIVAEEKVKYRLRETLLSELAHTAHSHGARPGFISFHEERKSTKSKGR